MIPRLFMTVLLVFFGPSVFAQTAHYMVESEHDGMKVILPPAIWKASQVDRDTVELDRGDDVEIHADWVIASYYDETSTLVERYSIGHPSYAATKHMKSFTSYVKRVDEEGRVLAVWPAMHTIARMGGLVRIHSTYFPNDRTKIVIIRVYERRMSEQESDRYYLPIFFRKETYSNATDEAPTQAMTHRRMFVE